MFRKLLRSGYTRSGKQHWRSCWFVLSVKRTTHAFLRSGYSMTSDLRGFPVNVKKGMTMRLRYSFAGAAGVGRAESSAASAADMQPVLKAPAAVDQQATGYVEVYTGWASTRATDDGFSTRFNGWALGGAGRGNYWVSREVSVQVDAQAEGTSYDFPGGGVISPATAIWSAATGAGAIRSNTCSDCSAGSAMRAAPSALRSPRSVTA